MNIKLPCTYRAAKIMGVLDHEIGTHYLRKFNESQQKWYKKKEFYQMSTCIATEEGLASIHGNIQTVLDSKSKPYLFSQAIRYYATFMAQYMGFSDLFKDLE